MGKKDKLIERIKKIPKDFTFEEMQTLLEMLGFEKTTREKQVVQE